MAGERGQENTFARPRPRASLGGNRRQAGFGIHVHVINMTYTFTGPWGYNWDTGNGKKGVKWRFGLGYLGNGNMGYRTWNGRQGVEL